MHRRPKHGKDCTGQMGPHLCRERPEILRGWVLGIIGTGWMVARANGLCRNLTDWQISTFGRIAESQLWPLRVTRGHKSKVRRHWLRLMVSRVEVGNQASDLEAHVHLIYSSNVRSRCLPPDTSIGHGQFEIDHNWLVKTFPCKVRIAGTEN